MVYRSGIPRRDDRITVMGVLNTTPDSFSDGGAHVDPQAALEHALLMSAQGADIIDVGGESTRPGAAPIDADEELRRVLPVVAALAGRGIVVSIDTYRAAVAAAALEAGATIVNDVSGGRADPQMAAVVRDAECPWILTHWRGPSSHMAELAVYDDVVKEVRHELLARVEAAVADGVPESALVLDPGLGFAKTATHNWTLLAGLEALTELGLPVLVGASRKSFLGTLLAGPDGVPRAVDDREDATTAITGHCAAAGVWGVRVHDVRPSVDAALTVAAIRGAS